MSKSKTTPAQQGILGYHHFIDPKPPADRLALLSGLCKTVIIGEIAALKYRLKPINQMFHDTTWSTQQKELLNFCGSNDALYDKYNHIAERYVRNKDVHPMIFTRSMCVFALEEIIGSNLTEIPGFTMAHSWEQLLMYLLAVNSELTKLTNVGQKPEEMLENLEKLNPTTLPLNELSIDIDPVFTISRGYKLMEYLGAKPETARLLQEYLTDTYQMSFDRFIYEISAAYMANNVGGANNIKNDLTGEEIDTSFNYHVKKEDNAFFKTLSKRITSPHPERLLSVKKYPFYEQSETNYMLFDNVLLLEKCYGQFINDFWFDKLNSATDAQGQTLFNIKGYRSIIGYFLEDYLEGVLKRIFQNAKYYSIKMFGELIVQKGREQIELADIYIRDKKKVFLGQVKSTGLYDTEKYGGDIDKLYKNNRKAFFKSFGVDQVVESIKNLETFALQIDNGFPLGKAYRIYPAIIVHEKAMQTPLMAEIFNRRFNELIDPHRNPKVMIFPLTLVHISDIERMQDTVQNDLSQFWTILDFNRRNPKFIPPLYNTLNRLNIKPTYETELPLFDAIITKYQVLPNNV